MSDALHFVLSMSAAFSVCGRAPDDRDIRYSMTDALTTDAIITSAVRSRIAGESELPPQNFEIQTDAGIVRPRGAAPLTSELLTPATPELLLPLQPECLN